MTDSQDTWTESDSELYQRLAPVAVPDRAGQMAGLLTLLPFQKDECCRIVEVGCGEGLLAMALLDCFPQARLTALDGSAAMRAQATARLQPWGDRVTIQPFDLAATGWLACVEGAEAVLSSLCLHHLDGPQKQTLFKALSQRLSRRGALLVADLVAPQRPEARQLFAADWDRWTRRQSLAETGSTDLFKTFVETEWNYFYFDDPVDTPSPLFDQLLWLKEAGFEGVDCFWLQAGHAIYGGYKSGAKPGGVSFEQAWESVARALKP
ncbi:MAG: class I SAM-dependent methyltransferase [Chloroflexota bacterium]